jgi:hypothetical protein
MYTPDAGNIHGALSHLEQALRILASSEDRQEVHPVWTAVPGTERANPDGWFGTLLNAIRACVLRVANAQSARVPNDLERLQSFGTDHRRPVPRITRSPGPFMAEIHCTTDPIGTISDGSRYLGVSTFSATFLEVGSH